MNANANVGNGADSSQGLPPGVEEAMQGDPSEPRLKWLKPLPLKAVSNQPDEYPLHALPPIIRDAVEEVQQDTQAPCGLVAASALSVVSAAVQSYVSVERAEGLRGPVSLYLLTIAKSGERKTACDKSFTSVLYESDDWQRETMNPVVAEYTAKKTSWEAIEAGYKDAIRKAAREGSMIEHLDRALGDHALHRPQAPRVPKVMRGDDTPEALASALAQWPVAAIISAEAGIIFGAHGMNPDSVMRNLAQANAIWDGGRIQRGRTTQQNIDIEGMRVTMGLQVQPAVVQNFMGSSGELARGIGWIARFLLSEPESTQGTRFYRDPKPGRPALATFLARARDVMSFPVNVDPDGRLITTSLRLDTEAKHAWVAFYDEVEEALGDGQEYVEVQDVASKTAEQAVRLAGCFHAFSYGHGSEIGRENMREGIDLARYYLGEALRYCKLSVVSGAMGDADKLEQFMLRELYTKKIYHMPERTLRQYAPKSVREKGKFEAAVDILEVHNRAKRLNVYGTKKDNSTKVICLNPYVVHEYHR